MNRAVVFAFATLAFGAAVEDRPRPTFEEFTANIHYPYYATTARQRQIKRGAHLLHNGMGETAVLQLMGPADYKVGWFDPVRNAHGQIWQYVVTWERRPTSDYHGVMVTVSFEEKGRKRTVNDFDASFGVRMASVLRASQTRSPFEGLYVIPSEVRGYQDERLELKNGRFRYWFSSDAVVLDEHGHAIGVDVPVRGTYRVDGHKVTFSNPEVEDRYTDVVNGIPVLWRLESKRIWEREHKIYDYGVLIRVVANGADAMSPSVSVLYDREMRKTHKEWRDPFVHGPQ
jgi:hypothetical protein